MVKAVLLVAGTVFILMGVIIPTIRKASEIGGKIRVRSAEEKELVDKVSILSSIDQDLLTSRVEILDLALPPRKDVVLYLSTIDGLSKELGLSFAGISLSPGDVTEASESGEIKAAKAAQKKGLQTLETQIKVDGSKERIYEFLRALENSFPLMQVKEVKVSAAGNDDGYSLSLQLGMLWAPREVGEVKGQVSLFTPEEESYFQQLSRNRRYSSPSFEAGGVNTLGKSDLFSPSTLPQSEVQVPQ